MRIGFVIVTVGAWMAGCNGDGKDGTDSGATGDRAAAILALDGDAAAGATVFADNCAVCHAADGSGGTGPSLIGFAEAEELVNAVLNGKGSMLPLDYLSDQEIADVLAHVESL